MIQDFNPLHMSKARSTPLSKERQLELVRAAQAGSESAVSRLVESNARFVFRIAQSYRGRGLDMEDLCQEGTRGLIRSIESFDLDRDLKFLTYAVWWVKQAMRNAIREQGRLIRLPANRLLKIKDKNPDKAKEANAERIDLNFRMTNFLRLDAPQEFGEFVLRDPDPIPAEAHEENEFKANIGALVNSLPDRLRLVVAFRFGLFGSEPETLEEVADRMGLTRERVRQLQNNAADILKKRLIQFHVERLP